MKIWPLGVLLFISLSAHALTSMEAEEQYYSFSESIVAGQETLDLIDGTKLTHHHKKLLVDALWDYCANPENEKRLASAKKRWKNIDFNSMGLPEQVRLYLLGMKLKANALQLDSMKSILLKKIKGKLDNRTLIILFNHSEDLKSEGLDKNLDEVEVANLKLKVEYDTILNSKDEQLKEKEIKEIFQLDTKKIGRSFIYLACRSDRNYPCRLIMKDKKGIIVKDKNDEIFSLPVLTKSKLDLTFNYENGDTPSGVYLINSVMPSADKKLEFGKNRRLMLEMTNRNNTLKVLPPAQVKRSWWKQMTLALELGREDLRIHGTGKINSDPDSLHPEFVASLGCIKTREGIYDGVKYNDQRLLLNALMRVQGLKVVRSNESRIKAHMVLFNLPGSGEVTLEDIQQFLK